jgi:hypothetical protein
MLFSQDCPLPAKQEPKVALPKQLNPRSFYISQLQNLRDPPTEAELQYLVKWNPRLPADRWTEWQLSFLRGLAAFGTPSTFLDGVEFKTHQFRDQGRMWPSHHRQGGGYDLRKTFTAQQKDYVPRITPEDRQLRTDLGCPLCQNVLQSLDARDFPQEVLNNAMLYLAHGLIQPNRYPAVPGHALYLPYNHDDMSTRVVARKFVEHGEKITEIECEPGKTRGALVNPAALEELFRVCLAFGLVALRGHPLNGSFLDQHDHWHLQPLECFPPKQFEKIAHLPPSSTEQVVRAAGSPYEILVLRQPSVAQFATALANLVNVLELDNQVFSPGFIPVDSEMAFVAPLRKEAVGKRYVQIGGAVNSHGFSPDDDRLQQRLNLYLPRSGEIDWRRYGMPLSQIPQYSREDIFRLHQPLDYKRYPNWGDGSPVLSRLSPLAQKIYRDVFRFQDKREDYGHADSVIHFTLCIAKLLGLTPEETEAAALMAIVHDTGWGSIPDVNIIWNKLVTIGQTGTPEERSRAKEEKLRLQILHQQIAKERILRLIPDHPYIHIIAPGVDDHDTRFEPAASVLVKAFWDGDWMWRPTRQSRFARSSGTYDRHNPQVVYERLKAEFSPKDFAIPWVYHIARLELAATMLALAPQFNWPSLPEQFLEEFKDELSVIRKS